MVAKLVYFKDLKPKPRAVQVKRKAQKTAGVKGIKITAAAKRTHRTKKGSAPSVRAEPNATGSKVVLDINGHRHTLQTLDARSENFGYDFGTAFKKSVRKARRENTLVIGRPDVAVAK